jgi:hypothetical protein
LGLIENLDVETLDRQPELTGRQAAASSGWFLTSFEAIRSREDHRTSVTQPSFWSTQMVRAEVSS